VAKYAIHKPCPTGKCASRKGGYGVTNAGGGSCCCGGGGCDASCCTRNNQFCGTSNANVPVSNGTEAVFTETGTATWNLKDQQVGTFPDSHEQTWTQTWSFKYRWKRNVGCANRTFQCISVDWRRIRVYVDNGVTTTLNDSLTVCAPGFPVRDEEMNSGTFGLMVGGPTGSSDSPFGFNFNQNVFGSAVGGLFEYDLMCSRSVAGYWEALSGERKPSAPTNVVVQTGCKFVDIDIAQAPSSASFNIGGGTTQILSGYTNFKFRRDIVVTKDCNGNPIGFSGGGDAGDLGAEIPDGQLTAGSFF